MCRRLSRACGIRRRRPGRIARGNERGGSNGGCVSVWRKCLGHVGAAADAARGDELHSPTMHAQVLQCSNRLGDRGDGGDANVLDEHVLRGSRAALHAVEHHAIGARLPYYGPTESGLINSEHIQEFCALG